MLFVKKVILLEKKTLIITLFIKRILSYNKLYKYLSKYETYSRQFIGNIDKRPLCSDMRHCCLCRQERHIMEAGAAFGKELQDMGKVWLLYG